jgi:hypothetical protein
MLRRVIVLAGCTLILVGVCTAAASQQQLEIYFEQGLQSVSPDGIHITSPPLQTIERIESFDIIIHPGAVFALVPKVSDAQTLSQLAANHPGRMWAILRADTVSAYRATWDPEHRCLRLEARGMGHRGWTEQILRAMSDEG